MILSKDIIDRLLLEIGSIYNYEMIITGSCADMFHINYTKIEDIDFIIDKNIYAKYKDNNNVYKKNMHLVLCLKHKKDGHELNRYLYGMFKHDITIKDRLLISTDIVEITYQSINYKVFSPQERYNQLINSNYKKNFSNYETKMIKVAERVESYKELLGIKD